MENSELITKALNYIRRENRNSEISIEDVAEHAGFSTDYFNRVFFAHTGFNVMEYVRFTRMKRAAMFLRTTDRDILDIALDCGYEAHESFTRAFKKQYGVSPVEYRKQTEKTEAFFGDFYNDTVGARLVHEFKGFKIADTDEVIDYMLETNALKYGYAAICCRVNGGSALYNGEDFRDGFIWFTEWDGRFMGDIICDDYAKIAEYMKIFSEERFDMVIYTLDDDKTITDTLGENGVNISNIKRYEERYYAGAPYEITPPDGYTLRLIKYEDYDTVRAFCDKRGCLPGYINHMKQELYQRDVAGNEEHSVFGFGIFYHGEMVGLSLGGLQRVHGFVINNCVVTTMFDEHKREELYQYAFKFVTNAALEKGALPFDDVQTPSVGESGRSGKFDSKEFGYKTAAFACHIK